MFNKLTLAVVVAITGMMMGGTAEVQANDCRYGGGGYQSYRAPVVYSSPQRSAYRYAPSSYRSYNTVSPYRSGYGGYGGYGRSSYRSGFSYGSPNYGRGGYGGSRYGRGGISIGIGF